MTGIKDYSTTAASNTMYFPENMAPSLVNDNLRQVQADIRNWYEQAEWLNLGFTPTYVSTTSFTVSGDKTSYYTVGRRIKIEDATTLYGVITASTYLSPNTTVTVTLDSGVLSTSISSAQPNIIKLATQSINVNNLALTGTTSLVNMTVSGLATFGDIKVIDSINDTNNNEVIKIGTVGSAVNEITITNATTGNAPSSSATGDDTNIAYAINSKGTSGVTVNNSILAVHGQCRLVKSGSNLVLQPFNGNNLLIGTKFYTIPSAGVSLAPSGLTSSTVYYIYAYMSGSTMTLEASTTGHATDTTTGVEIKSGDATRTLVGMGWATGTTTWGTGAADVASWFNRRPIALSVGYTVARTTTSASLVEINSEIRNNFLTWGDYSSQFNGAFRGSVAPSTLVATLNIDGSTNLVGTTFVATTGTNNVPFSLMTSPAATEGRHYTTIFGSVSTGTATFVSTADSTACGVLVTSVII